MQRRAILGLGAAVLLGAVLRLIWPSDMEYKADEMYVFSHATGPNPFPWVGQNSGVGTSNPGMGIWVYSIMVHVLGLGTPVSLVRGVMVLNVIALGLLLTLALKVVPARQREPWLWATALVAVNPLAVLFSRKLWIQSALPSFVMAALFAWCKRGTRAGAFCWGLVGAWLGQIHMTGFFVAAGVALWTALLDRSSARWRWWLMGSLFGAATLVPWLVHLAGEHNSPTSSLVNTFEPLFWPFWVSYPLGYNLFTSFGSDSWKFLAWPTIDGVSLYLVTVAFVVVTVAGLAIYAGAFALTVWPRRRRARCPLSGRAPEVGLALRGSFWGYGLLFTLSGFVFYRHYLIVAFALPFVSLAVCALLLPGRGRLLLSVLVVAEAALSVGYLTYVHARAGAPGGDYGIAYDHHLHSHTGWAARETDPGPAARVAFTDVPLRDDAFDPEASSRRACEGRRDRRLAERTAAGRKRAGLRRRRLHRRDRAAARLRELPTDRSVQVCAENTSPQSYRPDARY